MKKSKAKKPSRKGRFITVEGGEGVGKSTNMAFVREWLESRGIEVVSTREPGGTPLAEEIRALLLTPREEVVDSDAELLLMFAARAQHLNTFIRKNLQEGRWVLSDRFTDATYAYQGGGRGMDSKKIAILEQLVQGNMRPDLIILLDLAVDTGRLRAEKRGALDRFEAESIAFYQRVRDTYLDRARANPDRYKIVDASGSLAEVQQGIGQVMEFFLTNHNELF